MRVAVGTGAELNKRAINIGAGALACGFVVPLLTAARWDVVLASRYSTSRRRMALRRMYTNGTVVKAVLEQQPPLLPEEHGHVSTASTVWEGRLQAFLDTATPAGRTRLRSMLAEPDTKLVTLNVRGGLNDVALRDLLLEGLSARGDAPILVVSCENDPPASWPEFARRCNELTGVSAVASVADRMCVRGGSPEQLGKDYHVNADVFTERHRQWFIQADDADDDGLAWELGLDRQDPDAIHVVTDLRPYETAKRLLMNAPHLGIGALAAHADMQFVDEYVRSTEHLGRPDGAIHDPLPPQERARGLVKELHLVAELELESMPDVQLEDSAEFLDGWADQILHRFERFPDHTGHPLSTLYQGRFDRFYVLLKDRIIDPYESFTRKTGSEPPHLRAAIDAVKALTPAETWPWPHL